MKSHDVIIIGGGIAGLTCAKYLELANVDYIIISKLLGGNLFNATTIYNFPTYDTVEGSLLATKMVENTNIDRIEFDTVQKLLINYDPIEKNRYHLVIGESGEEYEGKVIVIATGSNPVRLNIDAPENCVNYCVICDGYKYKDKTVLVLGSGESAAQAALYLSSICTNVFIAFRRETMKVCAYTKELLKKKENIGLLSGKTLDSITEFNDGKFGFVFSSSHGENDCSIYADGCFVCWGSKPATDFLKDTLLCDKNGYVMHGLDSVIMNSMNKYYTGTVEHGVFVCGDVMTNVYHQLSIAAGNGATCALDVIKYLEGK